MACWMFLANRHSLSRLSSISTRSSLRLVRPCSGTGRRCSGLARGFVVPRSQLFAFSTLAINFIPFSREYTFIAFSQADTRPLALSSVTLSHDERRFLRRMIRNIKRWIQTFWEALVVSLRSAEVAIRLSPLVVLTPAALLSSKLSKEDPTYASNLAWWYTLMSLQGLGPAFVKLAQWAATRRDIFPPHICDRFAKLHDKGTAHSWRHSHALLTEAFADYESKGLHIDKNHVIGCGSAAQVYSGSLTTNEKTRQVAVKILHPRFQSMVERDLYFFKSVANLLHALPIEKLKMINLPRVVDNFAVILRRQADLRVEADNLVQFRSNFDRADDEFGKVFFPCPIDGWVDRNVLVEDLVVDATPIANFISDSSEQGWETRKELAGPLLQAFLKMVFVDNFCHCDLHPGNVLIKTLQVPSSGWFGDKTETKRTIVFLDAGIATSLSPNDRRNLKDLFKAVILNNGNEAGRLMVERAKYERCSKVEGGVDAFANGVEEIVSEFHDRRRQGLTLGAVRIGCLLSRVLDLCREHGVEVDPSMANIVISTLVLEGLGRSLNPDLNLIDCAMPFVLGRGKA